jgi:hypothetical protein
MRRASFSLCMTRAGSWAVPHGKPPLASALHRHTPLGRRSCTSPLHAEPMPGGSSNWSVSNRLTTPSRL